MSPVMNLMKEEYQQEPHQLNRTKDTHIATTYAGISDIHKNIVTVLEFWDGPVFKLDLVDAFEDKGQVLTVLYQSPPLLYKTWRFPSPLQLQFV